MSKLQEAESGRVLALVMDALTENFRYVANIMAEDASSDAGQAGREPGEGAHFWIAMDIAGPVRATVALECPGEDSASAARVSQHARNEYAEMLNVAVSHTVTDLYNNGYAVTISVPYVLESLGDRFTRYASLSAQDGRVLRVAFSGAPAQPAPEV